MAEVAESGLIATNLVSKYKLVCFDAAIGSASDTVVLTQRETGIQSIAKVVGAVITGGMDAAFSYLQVSASALTVTIVSAEQDGTPSTAWGDTTVSITVLGNL